MSERISEKKQVLKNLLLIVIGVASRIVVGMWLTTYLVNHLGKVAYGFVPMAYMLSEYIIFITNSINGATSRFLIVDIQRKDWIEGNNTFNTALRANLVLSIIQIPVWTIILYSLGEIFTIPLELKDDFFSLMLFSSIAFVLNVGCAVFTAPIFANNRLDVEQGVEIFKHIGRTVLIVLFFTFDAPKIFYTGLSLLIVSILANIIRVYYWRKLTPEMVIKPRIFDKEKLREILRMSVWSIVSLVGVLLYSRSNILIANRFVGVVEASEWAVAEQWLNAVMSVVSVLSTLVMPLIMAAYARNDLKRLKYVVTMSIKSTGVFMSIVCGVLVVQSYNLMTIWVGEEFSHTWMLLSLMLVMLPLHVSTVSLGTVFISFNRVKTPAIQSLVCGFIYVAIAVFLSYFTALGIYGIAISGMIMFTIDSCIIKPIYAAKIMNEKLSTILRPMLYPLLSIPVVIVFALPVKLFNIDSWARLAVSSMIAGIAILFAIWVLIFRKEDKIFIIKLLPEKIQARFAKLLK